MTPLELLTHLRGLGVEVRRNGDRLHVRAPKGTLDPELRQALDTNREEILALLRHAEKTTATPAPIPHIEHAGSAPLSFAQQRLWFLDRVQPGGVEYNLTLTWGVTGRMEVAALRRALGEITARHEVLRTTYSDHDGVPQQVIHAPAPVDLPVIDLTHLPAEDALTEADRLLQGQQWRPFDLSKGPLTRFRLFRVAEQEHQLGIVLHHILFDEWSENLLLDELAALYEAFRTGRPSPLEPLPIQYADYAAWQRTLLSGEAFDEQISYWRTQLAGVPDLRLPSDRPRPVLRDPVGSLHPFTVPTTTVDRLRDLSRRSGCTMFMTLLAAFQALLARYSGQQDFALGTPVAGRTRPETERLIGFFVNTLVLRADLTGDPSFSVLLARVRKTALDAYAHQDVPFDRLVEILRPDRDLSRNPLFDVLFSYALDDGFGDGGPPSDASPSGNVITKSDLGLAFVDTGDALTGCFEYSGRWLDAETVEGMALHLIALLEAVTAEPDRPLMDIDLADERERTQLSEWSRGPAAPMPPSLVPDRISRQCQATPEATALIAGNARLSYGDLDQRASRLAHHLRALGARPETVVAVCLDRSLDLVPFLLAIWRSGAVYLPLDPGDPPERLASLIEDSGARFLVTDGRIENLLIPDGVRLLRTDDPGLRDERSPLPAISPHVQIHPANAAYLIYTSGSTGAPKAVAVSHMGLANRLCWQTDAHRLGPADRVLHKTPLTFDVSLWELCCPLMVGASLVVAGPGEHRDPAALARLVSDAGVTVAHFVPSMLGPYLDEAHHGAGDALRLLVTSGEALTGPLARRCYRQLGSRLELHNLYGPTEASIDVTAALCPRDEGEQAPPIGVPVANTAVFVLDERLRPTPIGIPGELFIAGPQLARAYAGRAALTAERFIANPLASDGSRLYRTGDAARWRRDGRLEFLGRLDRQIKIRGNRIEPAEIEAALAVHPRVGMCAVAPHAPDQAESRLVAYLTVRDAEQAPTVDELRGFLRTRLPEAMIPAAFVSLPDLPLTSNGKLDRAALPALGNDRPELSTEFAEPATSTERELAGIWREVLRLDRVGRLDDFFALGGHSLLATRVIARVRDHLGTDLPLAAVFDAPTLAALAAAVDAAPRTPPAPPIAVAARTGALPLSFAQQRLWFLNQLEPESTEYHVPLSLHLAGALDLDVLRDALRGLAVRHEVLRTVFVADEEGTPGQIIRPTPSIDLEVTDLASLGSHEARAAARRLVDADARLPFDLSAGPVMRTRLMRLAEDEHVLALTLHHIACDEWSTRILISELSELYAALQDGRRPQLPELRVQYADYAAWQRQAFSGERLQEHLDYWRSQLDDLPVLYLPTDRRRPATRSATAGKIDFTVDARTTQRLRLAGRRAGASMFMTLLAAYQLLLSRCSGQTDIVVGSPTANRPQPEVEGLIGPFLNILPLRTDLSGGPTFEELIARVRGVALDAYAHQDLPFEQLVEELQPDRDRRRHPLFQVIMNYVVADGAVSRPDLADVSQCDFPATPVAEKVDMRLALTETHGELQGEVFYQADLFDRATVERLVQRFQVLLDAVTRDPDHAVDMFSLMPDHEFAEILDSAAGDSRLLPIPAGWIPDQVSAHASERPQAAGIVAGEATLSYGDLDIMVNRLAHHLRLMGVGPETVVALCLPLGADLIVSMLGVLRAGGTYLPLDPDAPLSRLAFQLDDSAANLVITTDVLADRLPDRPLPPLLMDDPDQQEALRGMPCAPPPVTVHPGTSAYLTYTSGSTGVPKAVTVTREGLAAYLHQVIGALGFQPGGQYAVTHSPAADFANTVLFGCLTQGGTLHLLDGELARDGRRLGGYLQSNPIDYLKLVPSQVTALLATSDEPTRLMPRTALVLGGEATPHSLASRLHELADLTGTALFNHYGPTEATVGATTHHSPGPPDTSTLPIGRPLPHARCLVLDTHLQHVPMGVPGELFLGGPGLARGYRNQPALTAERFVPDPFGETGSRLYRTGDLVRRLADGNLEFLGRIDDQLKIRGHRIEPGEVATALAAHREVDDTAVVACDDPAGGQRLAAYLVCTDPERPPTATELRAHLAKLIPEAAIPSVFVPVETIPRTAAGKIDRRALPAVETAGPASGPGGDEPRTLTEHLLTDVWRDVLRITRIGRDDDFFDLGGHSLLAANVIARLRAQHNIDLPLAAVFDAPVLSDLAAAIDERDEHSRPTPPLIPMNRARSERAFFAVPPMSGSPFCYRALGQALAPELAFIGLQAPGIDDARLPLQRVEDIAEHYLQAIRDVQPDGPYFLGGWSVGAIVALEMAQRLVSAGQEIGMLCLIAPARLKTRSTERQVGRVRSFINDLRAGSPDAVDQSALAGWIRPLRCEPGFSEDPSQLDKQLLLRRLEVIAAGTAAKAGYAARPFSGEVTILLPDEEKRPKGLIGQWRKIARHGVAVARVPGSHQSVMLDDANASAVASWLKPELISRGIMSLDRLRAR
ncbi:amino acid adenylation domain-containing protein [Actinomadura nitritigenes]|uniref:amino acid adenylation domain-containing protein n=1 Tax=Actinomadura nitritigenes TaxID=134602 RepID=UPI003D8D04EE